MKIYTNSIRFAICFAALSLCASLSAMQIPRAEHDDSARRPTLVIQTAASSLSSSLSLSAMQSPQAEHDDNVRERRSTLAMQTHDQPETVFPDRPLEQQHTAVPLRSPRTTSHEPIHEERPTASAPPSGGGIQNMIAEGDSAGLEDVLIEPPFGVVAFTRFQLGATQIIGRIARPIFALSATTAATLSGVGTLVNLSEGNRVIVQNVTVGSMCIAAFSGAIMTRTTQGANKLQKWLLNVERFRAQHDSGGSPA